MDLLLLRFAADGAVPPPRAPGHPFPVRVRFETWHCAGGEGLRGGSGSGRGGGRVRPSRAAPPRLAATPSASAWGVRGRAELHSGGLQPSSVSSPKEERKEQAGKGRRRSRGGMRAAFPAWLRMALGGGGTRALRGGAPVTPAGLKCPTEQLGMPSTSPRRRATASTGRGQGDVGICTGRPLVLTARSGVSGQRGHTWGRAEVKTQTGEKPPLLARPTAGGCSEGFTSPCVCAGSRRVPLRASAAPRGRDQGPAAAQGPGTGGGTGPAPAAASQGPAPAAALGAREELCHPRCPPPCRWGPGEGLGGQKDAPPQNSQRQTGSAECSVGRTSLCWWDGDGA